MADWTPESGGVPMRPLWILIGLGVYLAWTIYCLRRTGQGDVSEEFLVHSTLLDSAFYTAIVLAEVVWPVEPYAGVLRLIPALIVFLIPLCGAVRLSRRAVWASCSGGCVALAVLLAADYGLNADRIDYVGEHLPLFFNVYLGACAGYWFIHSRLRSLVYDGALAAVEAEKARQHLGVYVSEAVAQRALVHDSLELGGKRQPVAVLFSDLRGFTTYAESLAPEQLVRELNGYLAVMVEAIRAEGGLIDKYIGDAIMAVFGVPEGRDDDALRAIRAAWAMRTALIGHNAERHERKLPPLVQGIGVHYGPVVASHIGTEDRLQYTVVGDTVNLASRLEGNTKAEGVEVLVSATALTAALDALPDDEELHKMRDVGALAVRGHTQAVSAFTFESG